LTQRTTFTKATAKEAA